jgi:hypothetical protein
MDRFANFNYSDPSTERPSNTTFTQRLKSVGIPIITKGEKELNIVIGKIPSLVIAYADW